MSVIIQCSFCKVRFEQQTGKNSRCPICKREYSFDNNTQNANEAKKTTVGRQSKMSEKKTRVFQLFFNSSINLTKTKKEQSENIQEILIAKRRRSLWLVSAGVFLIIPLVLVMLLNIINTRTLSWSLIVVVPLVFSWIYLYFVLFLFYRPLTLYFLIALVTILLLFTLNFVMNTHWFNILALIIAISWIISMGVAVFWITRLCVRGLNVLAIMLLSIISGLLATEVYIDFLIYKSIQLTWSLITCVAVLPVIFLLFYLHKHRKFLYRWFHL